MESTGTEKAERIREIKIEKDMLHFNYLKDGSLQNQLSIKAGYEYLMNTFFKGEFATEAEIEKALNYIEYELTEHKQLTNNNEKLYCSNSILSELINSTSASREVVEEVFNKYVDCSTGEPAHLLGIEFSKEKLSIIIIARVVMYYLSFNQIELN